MNRSIVLVFLGAAVLWGTAEIRAQSMPSETPSKALSQLPLVPKGVNLGMPASELKVIRPNAQAMEAPRRAGGAVAAPTSKPREEVWLEAIGEGAFAGAATYIIRDGMLDEISIVQRFPLGQFSQERGSIIQKCLSLLGHRPDRHVKRVSGTDFDYLAPCLIWKGPQDRQVVFSVMPIFSEVAPHFGEVQLWIVRNTAFLERDLRQYDGRLHEGLFRGLGLLDATTRPAVGQ